MIIDGIGGGWMDGDSNWDFNEAATPSIPNTAKSTVALRLFLIGVEAQQFREILEAILPCLFEMSPF